MKKAGKKSGATTKKVFVGMSGGVDSSVSAALLKKQGYDVTGVFIKVWHPDFLPCNWREDRLDAMRVAAGLGIPFMTLDLEKEYKREVVDYMVAEYRAGRTPNPDVMCNKEIKFGAFLRKALSLGADYVATGHYAQVKDTFELHESVDENKDQSYFLWTLTQKELSHILFPVGALNKPQVRVLAKKFKLFTADKKDSQGLCFIGHVDMKDFLKKFLERDSAAQKGDVLDTMGNKIGTHDGSLFYTIGQRHGFTVKNTSADDAPLYVIAKDITKNTITVGERGTERGTKNSPANKHAPDTVTEVLFENASWTLDKEPDHTKTYQVRARYRQVRVPCTISKQKTATKNQPAIYKVTFEKPQTTITPGQSFVFYDKTLCLGGGIIK